MDERNPLSKFPSPLIFFICGEDTISVRGSFAVQVFGLGISCGSIWGSFEVLGSFAGPKRSDKELYFRYNCLGEISSITARCSSLFSRVSHLVYSFCKISLQCQWASLFIDDPFAKLSGSYRNYLFFLNRHFLVLVITRTLCKISQY